MTLSATTMSSSHDILKPSSLCDRCASIFTSALKEWKQLNDNYYQKDYYTSVDDTIRTLADSHCHICYRLLQSLGFQRLEISFIHIDIKPEPATNPDFWIHFCVRLLDSDTSSIPGFFGIHVDKGSGLGMGHSLQSGTSSSHSLQQARDWIHQCRTTHHRCVVAQPRSWLPTRLVYIESSSNSTLSARICDRRELEPDTLYLTLSHRWGNKKFTTLTSDVLGSWKEGIPTEKLSRVFQDALHATQLLGFTCIWIDSLCIIQDDPEDWERESMVMHRVYSGAVCNLSAIDSDSCNDGLINTHRSNNPLPPIVQPVWAGAPSRSASCNGEKEGQESEQQASQIVSDQRYFLTPIEPLAPIYSSPLFSRAWVLQEQILAPRALLFSKEKISWECKECMADEIWPSGFPYAQIWLMEEAYRPIKWRAVNKGAITSLNLRELSRQPKFEIYHAWKCIVVNYTRRAITYPSDRLPGLAGLAIEFNSILKNDRYCSGTWMNDPSSLLWKLHNPDKNNVDIVAEIPTWSWARYQSSIHWKLRSEMATDWTNGILAQCLDTQSSDSSTSKLHLHGPLVLASNVLIDIHDYREVYSSVYGATKESNDRMCMVDYDTPGIEPCAQGCYVMPMLKDTDDGYSLTREGEQETMDSAWGMLLKRERALGEAVYTRIGIAVITAAGKDVESIFPLLQQDLCENDFLDMYDGNCTIVVV